jgi:PiT family inorganic phosphate transporter
MVLDSLPLLVVGLLFLGLLGFTNGANDISKAVACLAGAGVTSIRSAVLWGSLWTAAGGVLGVWWGVELIKSLSTGVYANAASVDITSLPVAVSVGMAPIFWVGLATWRGWPVSTTHAVVGGLIGAGIAASGAAGIAWSAGAVSIVLPLIISPVISIVVAYAARPALRYGLGTLGRYRLCLAPYPRLALAGPAARSVSKSSPQSEGCIVCADDSPSAVAHIGFRLSEDVLHWLTSGLLSFARGLNDAPKLIAVCLPILTLGGSELSFGLFVLTALAMALGGLLAGRRVMQVLAFRITKLDPRQGFAANLIATILVLGASRLGLPVSTTHVAASAIIGVGVSGGTGLGIATVRNMVAAWFVTAPAAAMFAAVIHGLTVRLQGATLMAGTG